MKYEDKKSSQTNVIMPKLLTNAVKFWNYFFIKFSNELRIFNNAKTVSHIHINAVFEFCQ